MTIGSLQDVVAGSCGTSGTQFNSIATSARLSYINGIEKVPGGAFIFTDFYAGLILQVSNVGILSVFAGTVGVQSFTG